MTSLYLRPDERTSQTPGPTPGVLVVVPGVGRMFFPGGSYDLAMILARAVLTPEQLAHPDARIEWGTKDGPAWDCERKYKVPANAPVEAGQRELRPGDPDYGWGGAPVEKGGA